MNRFRLAAVGLVVISLLAFSKPFLHPAFGQDQILGVVVETNLDSRTLVMRDIRNGRNIQFSINDDTMIKDKNGVRELSDLESGMAVLIEYDDSGTEVVAKAIAIQESGK